MVNSLKNGVLPPDHRQLIMVVERKGVDRLGSMEPARTGRPPSVLPQRKGTQGSNDL
jgi:hypothetical protein